MCTQLHAVTCIHILLYTIIWMYMYMYICLHNYKIFYVHVQHHCMYMYTYMYICMFIIILELTYFVYLGLLFIVHGYDYKYWGRMLWKCRTESKAMDTRLFDSNYILLCSWRSDKVLIEKKATKKEEKKLLYNLPVVHTANLRWLHVWKQMT